MIWFWLACNVAFTAGGCYIGFKQKKLEVSIKPTRLARKVKKDFTCLLNPVFCFLFCGVVPFIAVCAQFYYVFTSVSGGQNITILYWSLYISMIASAIMIAEVNIIRNYISLCYGEHRWWWNAFAYGSSLGLCVFAMTTYHLTEIKVFHIHTLAMYTLMQFVLAVSIGLASGALSVVAAFMFNQAIFQKTRQD